MVSALALSVSLLSAAPEGTEAQCVASPTQASCTDPSPALDPDPASDALPSPEERQQAADDVQTILTDTSALYLKARARLVASPVAAAAALLDRLNATPPPGPAERKRLLDVLAELSRPEDLPRFAAELRRAVLQASSPAHAVEAAQRWRPLLLQQGQAASGIVESLVGDRQLPLEVRSVLLEDLIASTPSERLVEYTALLGRGQVALQQTLGRALERRAATRAEDRAAILAAIDAALAAPQPLDPRDFATQVRLRIRIGGADPALRTHLEQRALDGTSDFAYRVAAIDGLGRLEAAEPLDHVARAALGDPEATAQQREVLASLALQRLEHQDSARVREIVTEADLLRAPAPRLATLGLRHADLPPDAQWLDRALESPWPQVRQAALTRVSTGCREIHIPRITPLAAIPERGGESDRAVARAALAALGQCKTPRAHRTLRRVLRNLDQHIDLRAEAARQLVRHGGPPGIDSVARVLLRGPGRRLERRLAVALRYAPHPTPAATRVLCARANDKTEVAGEVAITLAHWYPDRENVCGESSPRSAVEK